MIVVSHTGRCGRLIFVVYLKTVNVLSRAKLFEMTTCVKMCWPIIYILRFNAGIIRLVIQYLIGGRNEVKDIQS